METATVACGLLGMLAVGLLVVLIWLTEQHALERREWREERAALLEQAVPGLRLRAEIAAEPVRRRYGDAAEWEIERRRNGELA